MTGDTRHEPATEGPAPRPVPRNTAYDTGYLAHYLRLAGERRRFTSADPLGAGLAAGDGAPGGMADADHAAGKPSRRELEIAAWLTADVSEELRGAQFDIATLLAKLEQLRDSVWMGTRNMLEAEHRAYEAERGGALGELASRYTLLTLAATALERDNEMLRAAADICHREHCQAPAPEAAGAGSPPAGTAPEADLAGIDLDMLAVDIAGMLDRYEYPIDVADNHIRPVLAAFITAIMANAAADNGTAG